ncbi:MAG TPA: RNA polymerase sigma factor [Candidatus Kapabacteria bacterium]|nr:RNA polymerase sigma factor [Candidatus Kapabacteria bacterium]
MKTYSDSELYALLRGDHRAKENAFTELYARYSSRVYVYCCRIMGDNVSAEDVFQETFIRFLQTAEKGQDVLNIPAYLLRIARNLCFNAKRDDKSAAALSVDDFQFSTEDKTVESAELGRLIEMALSLLTEEHREAFVLQAYNGLSYEEIAEVTNVPVTTVRNRVVRAKKRMREILSPYMEELK